MRRLVRMMIFAAGMLVVAPVFASDPLTNTNQGAAYIRMLARNASRDIDGVYYNPAGLVYLDNGWHFSLNDQAYFQKYTITNSLSTLNSHTFEGKSKSFLFPTVQAAYRKGNFAYSLGLSVFDGDGNVNFDKGLPSLETEFSMLKRVMKSGYNTTYYTISQSLKRHDVTYGGQLGVSYKINDMLSVAAGARIVYQMNTYNANVSSMLLNPVYISNANGAMSSASTFYTNIGNTAMAEATTSEVIKVKQKGFGVTPIISVDFNYKKLLVTARYEVQTNMKVKNNTTQGTGLYPNGSKDPADIPALLSLGAAYDIFPKLKLSLAYNHSFNKNAATKNGNYTHDSNECAVGAEWNLSKLFLVSAGYQYANFGVIPNYQLSTHSFSPYTTSAELSADSYASHTIGAGGAIKIGNGFRINLGYSFTKYPSSSRQLAYNAYDYSSGASVFQETATETFKQRKHVIAIGMDFRF